MGGTARKSIPAVAIVDSRNVRGQIEDVFGQGRQIEVAGVIAMLADFGFDVSDVWVGVATTGDTRRGSARLQQGLAQNQAFAERVLADPRGHVMEGRLVERGSAPRRSWKRSWLTFSAPCRSQELHTRSPSGVARV